MQAAFGKPKRAVYNLQMARAVLSLDSDFLGSDARSVAMAHDWAELRDPDKYRGQMSRLYAVEPIMSITGSNADHRLRLRHSDVEAFAFEVARVLYAEFRRPIPQAIAQAAAARAKDLSESAKAFAAAAAAGPRCERAEGWAGYTRCCHRRTSSIGTRPQRGRCHQHRT